MHVLPFEICGWFARKEGIPTSSWLLVLSADPKATLASNVVIRDSLKLNVVAGRTDVGGTPDDVARLQGDAEASIIPRMRAMSGLVEVVWDLASVPPAGAGWRSQVRSDRWGSGALVMRMAPPMLTCVAWCAPCVFWEGAPQRTPGGSTCTCAGTECRLWHGAAVRGLPCAPGCVRQGDAGAGGGRGPRACRAP